MLQRDKIKEMSGENGLGKNKTKSEKELTHSQEGDGECGLCRVATLSSHSLLEEVIKYSLNKTVLLKSPNLTH